MQNTILYTLGIIGGMILIVIGINVLNFYTEEVTKTYRIMAVDQEGNIAIEYNGRKSSVNYESSYIVFKVENSEILFDMTDISEIRFDEISENAESTT